MICNNISIGVMSTTESTEAVGERATSVSEAAEGFGRAETLGSRLRAWWARRSMNGAAYVRLHCELRTARPEFELLAKRSGSEDESWVAYGRELLEMAEEALDRGAIDEAWRHLNTARRFEVYGLERLAAAEERRGGRSELEVRAAAVREEALDALSGWQRRAVADLLCDGSEELRDDVTDSELRAASRILHERYEHVHMGRSERQRQFNQLVMMAALSGLSLLVLTLADWMWADAPGLAGSVASFLATPFGATGADVASPGFALFMTIAGVMGASLFGMRSLRNRALSTDVAQQISQLTVTGARGVIGAVSALLFYFVLQTPLLSEGTVLAPGLVTPELMIVVGFAAGYSERMAPDVVSRVASITDSDSDEDDDPDE
jgi:hypothetical protein